MFWLPLPVHHTLLTLVPLRLRSHFWPKSSLAECKDVHIWRRRWSHSNFDTNLSPSKRFRGEWFYQNLVYNRGQDRSTKRKGSSLVDFAHCLHTKWMMASLSPIGRGREIFSSDAEIGCASKHASVRGGLFQWIKLDLALTPSWIRSLWASRYWPADRLEVIGIPFGLAHQHAFKFWASSTVETTENPDEWMVILACALLENCFPVYCVLIFYIQNEFVWTDSRIVSRHIHPMCEHVSCQSDQWHKYFWLISLARYSCNDRRGK